MSSNVFAVLVTYNPIFPKLIALLQSLRAADVVCCVVDNSAGIDFSAVSGLCHLVLLGDNKGIATAQNIGIETCLAQGAERIVFFDQDSVISERLIAELVDAFKDPEVKISAPVFFNESQGFEYPLVDVRACGTVRKRSVNSFSEAIDVSTVISSGTMVDASVFSIVGCMDERLFIDYVDTEWCLRCMREGISIRVNPRASMLHSIGDQSLRFRFFVVPVHSPLRRYYRIRNSLLLLRLRHVPLLYSLREIALNHFHQLVILLFLRDRYQYLRYCALAIRDGIKGVSGRIHQ
ncbi:dTDP-rhamnosyl transferase RfbF [Pseudomonas sp. 8AS]|uniref:glycosyltransferase family 2 protein n=1 Tax=Pseudomonas sp. 8AS TaxID=2653163 RepID=UPI0012EFBA33|nr:glycosyltransferase family 2 protein [Pseudomonas sp. 8AS]VXB83642.1 dTDP-rhamnosyl transferase RfbF [Pseudomonas sp. 8AS]